MVSFIELCAQMNNSCFGAAINCAYLEGGIKRKNGLIITDIQIEFIVKIIKI